MIIWVLAFFTLILVGAIGLDLFLIFKTWFSRIHFGKYEDEYDWEKHILTKATRWLKRTPKVPLTDQKRWVALDIIKGQYTRGEIQYWQEAALLLALPSPQFTVEVHRSINKKITPSGDWETYPQHIDGAIFAYAMLKHNRQNDECYKQAMDRMWQVIQAHIGEDGTVIYRKSMAAYRYVDTIGFICPFLITYGVKNNKPECIDLAIHQIESFFTHGMSSQIALPAHAYQINSKVGTGLYGWGRGMAWLALGVIDSWQELPNHHPYKQELENRITQLARVILRFQQDSGAWNWLMTRKEARADSSTTATLGYFLAHAAYIDEIAEQCCQGRDRAIHYLMKVTRRTGAIDFSQGDTKDIGVYSQLFDILPFTQGMTLRLLAEKRRYQEAKKDRQAVS
ncbi:MULTISPECIES: glycoside hydrolase family 88 protein [Cytobacillus]|uniref:Glycoside hydrolase family 88 protein n=1 Tax=Cytobacillus stercorigallinarum TaxID=2762240 RepID=A0ABR8QUY9_9BACI|nr:glycoside hydrolase family 88 protein [Cytobacillus stercorigallinarum]MBD7939082.1 glycoside hydrolase family 88 protein [Cytobacillus stercorigallinarum]